MLYVCGQHSVNQKNKRSDRLIQETKTWGDCEAAKPVAREAWKEKKKHIGPIFIAARVKRKIIFEISKLFKEKTRYE